MSEIIFRLPAKTIQYGYVEVKATPEELGGAGLLGDPEELGALYAIYVGKFLEGEQKGLASYLGDSRMASKPEVDREHEAEPGDPQAAARRIVEQGLGGVVIEEHTHKFAYGDDGHGHSGSFCECGQEEGEERAPDAPPWLAPPSAEAKPWESGGVKPTVAQIDW